MIMSQKLPSCVVGFRLIVVRFNHARNGEGTTQCIDALVESSSLLGMIKGRQIARKNADGAKPAHDKLQEFRYHCPADEGVGRHGRQPLGSRCICDHTNYGNRLGGLADPYLQWPGMTRRNRTHLNYLLGMVPRQALVR